MFKESKLNINREKGKNEILYDFSEQEKNEIEEKRKILSSIAFFIGKDFQIPVELNEAGAGWHWNFKDNVIKIDPKDLLEKPMDYLRFVVSHEGGHRRISRVNSIPIKEWNQPGFSFMMNSIEDPRNNNFVAENYSKFKKQMELAYNYNLDTEQKHKKEAKEKLGYQPKFMQAGFEYIKQWFRETQEQEIEIDDDLSEDTQQVVEKTIKHAQDSWWHYPSKQEADDSENGENNIRKYAQISYKINKEKIWPEFKKLVEQDMEDQKMQELFQDMQEGEEQTSTESEQESSNGLPQDLKDKLTDQEQQELEDAISEAIDKSEEKEGNDKLTDQEQQELEDAISEAIDESEGKEGKKEKNDNYGKPVDIDSLSEELKKKIEDYIDSLPDDKKQDLEEKAKKKLKEFEQEINEELEGKLTENPEQASDRKSKEKNKSSEESKTEELDIADEKDKKKFDKEIKKYHDQIEKSLKKDANVYEQYRREILPIIDRLEMDLREIFIARRAGKWISGFKKGKRINIKKRIQEKVKGVSVMESKAWEKKEMPFEKDYAISLLVDLSGSMRGEKIEETFKAVIILSEVLNRLSISNEILGFNDKIYEYKKFNQDMSKDIRENMGGMLKEVENFEKGGARYNDDGWALEQSSLRIDKQKEDEKFLIILSDGIPEESPQHSGNEFDLKKQIEKILKITNQKLIGLGIGQGTEHVDRYYPNSLANIEVEEMGEKLANIIKQAIVDYNKF